jgi:hypothetical protein
MGTPDQNSLPAACKSGTAIGLIFFATSTIQTIIPAAQRRDKAIISNCQATLEL